VREPGRLALRHRHLDRSGVADAAAVDVGYGHRHRRAVAAVGVAVLRGVALGDRRDSGVGRGGAAGEPVGDGQPAGVGRHVGGGLRRALDGVPAAALDAERGEADQHRHEHAHHDRHGAIAPAEQLLQAPPRRPRPVGHQGLLRLSPSRLIGMVPAAGTKILPRAASGRGRVRRISGST